MQMANKEEEEYKRSLHWMNIFTGKKVEKYDRDMVQICKAYIHHHEEIDHVHTHEVHHEAVDQCLTHQDDWFAFQ